MPPIIPIREIINSNMDFRTSSTLTFIGDMSYLKKIPGVPWVP